MGYVIELAWVSNLEIFLRYWHVTVHRRQLLCPLLPSFPSQFEGWYGPDHPTIVTSGSSPRPTNDYRLVPLLPLCLRYLKANGQQKQPPWDVLPRPQGKDGEVKVGNWQRFSEVEAFVAAEWGPKGCKVHAGVGGAKVRTVMLGVLSASSPRLLAPPSSFARVSYS